MRTKLSRRHFFARSAGAAAAVASGRRRILGANDRVNLAYIGCGGRGSYLMNEAAAHAKDLIRIAAVCDVWRVNLERGSSLASSLTGDKPRAVTRYGEALSLKDVDAVVIATPDFAHCTILRDAVRAGKDAFVEKPMGMNTRELREAVQAVELSRRIVAVGTQRRSDERHREGVRMLSEGILGRISVARSVWHDAAPRWNRPYSDVRQEDVDWKQFLMGLPDRPFDARRFRCWHLYRDYTIGVVGLLGAHGIDLASWYMNDLTPVSAVAHGGVYVWNDGREHADTLDCLIEYSKGWLLNYATNLGNNRTEPELVIRGTRGSYDTSSWTFSGEGGGSDAIQESVTVPAKTSAAHILNWLRAVRDRKQPNATVRDGLAHSIAAIMAHRSLDTGVRQHYDPKRIEIHGEGS